MSQSSRFVRFGFVVATGIIALVGFAPSGAVAGSTDSSHVGQPAATSTATIHAKGEGWCC
jgi:hypothetical protein